MKTSASSSPLHSFFLADKTVRGAILDGTVLVQDMQARHNLGTVETLILGQALLAASLMASPLKGNDEISLRMDCSGPIKGLLAEATATGEVRGYLKQNYSPLSSSDFALDATSELVPLWGEGFLVVTRYLEEGRHPFSGSVALQSGNISAEVARYYHLSEQIPTALHLSIVFDESGRPGQVAGAAGLLVQAMPDASAAIFADIEQKTRTLPSLAKALTEQQAVASWLHQQFSLFSLEMLTMKPVHFQCRCSEMHMRRLLLHLPLPDLEEMRDNGPFPVQLTCHFCTTLYPFDQGALEDICREKQALLR